MWLSCADRKQSEQAPSWRPDWTLGAGPELAAQVETWTSALPRQLIPTGHQQGIRVPEHQTSSPYEADYPYMASRVPVHQAQGSPRGPVIVRGPSNSNRAFGQEVGGEDLSL